MSGVADQLPGMLENVNILDHNVTQKNGIECGEIVYTFTDQEITYKQKQLYYFNKIFIIVITFRPQEDLYNSQIGDLDYIQDSIRLSAEN